MNIPSEDDYRDWQAVRRILLVGAGFSNKGAEAMALTAVAELGQRYSKCECVVASYAKEEHLAWGRHVVDGHRFELIPNRKRLSHLLRVPLHGLARHTPLRNLFVRGDAYLSRVADADLVIDLSGFALSDRRPLWRRLVYGLEILTARTFGRPFVAFTQALGPFDTLSTAVIARTCLPMAALVIARGNRTRAFLQRLGIDRRTRVEQCADSAYLFPAAPRQRGRELLANAVNEQRPIVGIIPNINIFHHWTPKTADNPYISLLCDLCTLVSRDLHAAPVLVCHEEFPERRDDGWLARVVRERSDVPVHIVAGRVSAAELKAVVGECDMVIASRFHSIVGAISMQTPVVALGWAHKYTELMQEAGLRDFVLDAREADNQAIFERVRRGWTERDAIRVRLSQTPDRLVASARGAFDYLLEQFPLDPLP